MGHLRANFIAGSILGNPTNLIAPGQLEAASIGLFYTNDLSHQGKAINLKTSVEPAAESA